MGREGCQRKGGAEGESLPPPGGPTGAAPLLLALLPRRRAPWAGGGKAPRERAGVAPTLSPQAQPSCIPRLGTGPTTFLDLGSGPPPPQPGLVAARQACSPVPVQVLGQHSVPLAPYGPCGSSGKIPSGSARAEGLPPVNKAPRQSLGSHARHFASPDLSLLICEMGNKSPCHAALPGRSLNGDTWHGSLHAFLDIKVAL